MNSVRTPLLACIACLLFLCLAGQAFAAAEVQIAPAGDGAFFIQGAGFQDVAALELTISYDPAALANPRVVPGSLFAGSLSAINANVPGSIRMAFIRTAPVSGSGIVATIAFDRKTASSGKIISLSARLARLDGTLLPVLVKVSNPPDAAPANTALSPDIGTTAGNVPSGPAPAQTPARPPLAPFVGIAVTQPEVTGGGTGQREQKEPSVGSGQGAVPSADLTTAARKTDTAPAGNEATPRKIYTQKSVLELFREQTGARSPRSLMALFDQESMIGFRQEPAVALTDGKTTVKVTFISAAGGRKPSDIAIIGAKLLDLRPDPDSTNTWVLELQPFKGEHQASVTIPQGSVLMICPLVVAPKVVLALERSQRINEVEFQRFLTEREAKGKPKYDLNKDGKRDHIDDFIYTANYLVATGRVR